MDPQFEPGDRVRVRIERGVELTGTVLAYLSGDLFVVELEGDDFVFPQNVRARDMRRIEEDGGDASGGGP